MAGEILMLVLLLWHWSEGAPVCTVTCEEGQYCFQSECRSCPHGTFTEDPVHQMTSCTPWTTWPAEAHFVVARNGSSASDVLWKCQDGYIQSSENICELITTTTHSSTTTTTTNRTFLSTVASTTVADNHSTGSETNLMAIIVPILVCLVMVGIGLVLIKYHGFCFGHTRNNQSAIVKSNGVEVKLLEDKGGGDQEVTPSDRDKWELSLFRAILQELIKSGDDAEIFVRALPDPSGTFQAQNVIKQQRGEHLDKETYLLRACMVWACKNRSTGELTTKVGEALGDIDRTDVLQLLQQQLEQDPLACGRGDMVDSSTGVDHPGPQVNARGASPSSRFWHFLAKQLGINDSEALLYRLPNTDQLFNAKNFYDQKKNFDRLSFPQSCVDTLKEWHLRNADCVFIDCIQQILVDMDRSDVLNHPEFLIRQKDVEQGSV